MEIEQAGRHNKRLTKQECFEQQSIIDDSCIEINGNGPGVMVALVASIFMSIGGYGFSIFSFVYWDFSVLAACAVFFPGALFLGVLFYSARFLGGLWATVRRIKSIQKLGRSETS